MTNPTPPQGPAPTTPETPSNEDRMLAAISYASYFTGFWLIVPIVIYLYRREKSRFVAHHALRAVLLHIALVPVAILAVVLGFTLAVVVGISFEKSGSRGNEQVVAGVLALLVYGSAMLPFLIFFIVTAIAALRAFQGRVDTRSWMGRITEWGLGKDASVMKGSGG